MNAAVRLLVCLALLSFVPAYGQDQSADKTRDESPESLSAVVRVKARILPNARSAETLGTQR